MSTARAGTGLAVALLLAGCTAASTPVEAPLQSASVAAPSAALASPSPSPSTVGPALKPTAPPLTAGEAGAAFQKADLAFGRLLFELGETYRDQAACAWTVGFPGAVCTESQLAAGKAYFTELSTGLDEYVVRAAGDRVPGHRRGGS